MNDVIIGSGNGLLLVRRQAITWTDAGLLSIGSLRTKFSEILIEIHISSFKKMPLKISSAKLSAIFPGVDELKDDACWLQVETVIDDHCVMGPLPDTQNCGLRMRKECRERFPQHRLQRKVLVNDSGMQHIIETIAAEIRR